MEEVCLKSGLIFILYFNITNKMGKDRMNEKIVGYQITTLSKRNVLNTINSWLIDEGGNETKYFVCANPHSLEIATRDTIFESAIKNADIVVPDGFGIIIASKILGGKINERITGTDIFIGLSEILNEKGNYRYYFLGSTDNNLKNIKVRMKQKYKNIEIAGTYSPPFKKDFSEKENRIMIKEINNAHPDVLWIGMTAPKQEKWIFQNKDKLDVKFIGAIGAVFDFFTGNVKRSHPWFLKHGLEWLPRLLQEPRRLWRRNMVSGPAFLLRVVKGKG